MAQTAVPAGSIPGPQDLASRTEPPRSPRAGALSPDFARIRRVLRWLAAVVVVVVVGGVTFSTLQERREWVLEAQRDSLITARAIEPFLARIIGRAGDYLERHRGPLEGGISLSQVPERRFEELFSDRPRGDLILRYVVVADEDGRVAWVGGAPGSILSVRDRQFFAWHAANRDRRPRVGAPIRSRIDGEWRLPISLRIDHPDGSFAGVVNTAIEVEEVARYFGSLGLPAHALIHLVAVSGESLARHPPAREVDRARLAGTVREVGAQGEGTFWMRSPVTGEDTIGAFRRLGDLPLYAIVGFEADPTFARWRWNTAARILAGGFGLGLAAFFIVLLSRRLRAEQQAMDSLAKFRRAVDLSGDLMLWVDFDGAVHYMNEAAAGRLGVDANRLPRGLHVSHIAANYTDLGWATLRARLMTAGEGSYLGEHRNKDGTIYPVQVSATHVVVDDRDLAFLICRDLSAQRRQEQAIRDLNETLEQRVQQRTAELADANAELESFAYSVSHDLRAPLNHLSAYAGSLREGDGKDEHEQRRLADKICERSDYMNDLIDALLALSRVGRAQVERRDTDLSAIAVQIDAEHRKLEPGRDVLTRIEPGLRANADSVLLRTLLENLIGNAWKYTSKVQQARIEIFSENLAGVRTFVVRDNGAGFDPRYAERLFSPFARLHNQSEFPGNGVGLATARRIVSRHGGRIWGESRPDEGATFRFTLG